MSNLGIFETIRVLVVSIVHQYPTNKNKNKNKDIKVSTIR
jgi:hypothetical protein